MVCHSKNIRTAYFCDFSGLERIHFFRELIFFRELLGLNREYKNKTEGSKFKCEINNEFLTGNFS